MRLCNFNNLWCPPSSLFLWLYRPLNSVRRSVNTSISAAQPGPHDPLYNTAGPKCQESINCVSTTRVHSWQGKQYRLAFSPLLILCTLFEISEVCPCLVQTEPCTLPWLSQFLLSEVNRLSPNPADTGPKHMNRVGDCSQCVVWGALITAGLAMLQGGCSYQYQYIEHLCNRWESCPNPFRLLFNSQMFWFLLSTFQRRPWGWPDMPTEWKSGVQSRNRCCVITPTTNLPWRERCISVVLTLHHLLYIQNTLYEDYAHPTVYHKPLWLFTDFANQLMG